MEKPLISVVIAARNEERYIGKCLDSLIKQDYPKENLEILVIDGKSEDKTKKIVEKYKERYSFIKLLDNPKKVTPYAFNIGIRNSEGRFIIILSAHCFYKQDYLSICLKHINEYDADIVGGVVRTVPSRDTLAAKSITLAFSHPFGSGNAYYRTGHSRDQKKLMQLIRHAIEEKFLIKSACSMKN